MSDRDRFLTAPWPLFHARVEKFDPDLIAAAGLPAPLGDPLVHYSTGVDGKVARAVLL